jgi:2'-5' RNA ligase
VRPSDAGALRCFVALLPDADTRDRLDRLGAAMHGSCLGSRRVRADNLHLTLAFIGAIPAARAQAVAVALAAEPARPFDFTLDAIDAFAGARVLFAGCAQPPASDSPLARCAAQVRGLLQRLDVAFDRKPFVPHVTLLRNLARGDAPRVRADITPPIRWHAHAPRLMQSRQTADGLRYLPIAAGARVPPSG